MDPDNPEYSRIKKSRIANLRKKIQRLKQITNPNPQQDFDIAALELKIKQLEKELPLLSSRERAKTLNYWIVGESIIIGILLLVILGMVRKKRKK